MQAVLLFLSLQVTQAPNANVVIRAPFQQSEIVLTTTERLAGAVHSLTWNGKEFIDSVDHGRQLQSAASFDCKRKQPFWAECYNPTEAGSRLDGAGKTSTSKLLAMRAKTNELESTTQMAFWLAPGEKSSGRPALNETILSQHRLTKKIRIGAHGLPNVLDYQVTFHVPTEDHTFAQFEALTGYMPAEFSKFYRWNPQQRRLEPLSDGPGEQSQPVVLATESGSHAMGIYSPDQPAKGYVEAGYGRFRFIAEKVVKWNCTFRQHSATGIAAGNYSYQMYVPIGSLADVEKSLQRLIPEK